ncbi:GATA type transcriptional activator of nitrogen-regulated proteins [Coemansia brasiliensis]|uniref:GATA type transcriptional activator of nitrogen-regulated proteins n=1 Tax=Coemansia brasiliensis TaxID=2650707 RepID=A0A9W8IGZ2_9FUNG|nr:GATA type transcriptional activator of nitrogen-regulated proteins [Coemansia brasiliensis]
MENNSEKSVSRVSIAALLHQSHSETTSSERKSKTAPASPSLSSSSSSASPLSASQPIPAQAQSKRASAGSQITCANCKTSVTPLWRRDPATGAHLCNRCGLYLKTYNVMHPLTRIKRRAINVVQSRQGSQPEEMDDVEQIPRPANCHPWQLSQLPASQRRKRVTPKQQISLGIKPRCFNCKAEQTPLWRRDPADNIICNACGLYYKLHGKTRPVAMRRTAVKRRNRASQQAVRSVPAAAGGSVAAPLAISGEHGHGHGGLDVLMNAALGQKPKQVCSMLDSLASVATAEMAAGGSREKEMLLDECRRLEHLLAKSKAKLGTLE